MNALIIIFFVLAILIGLFCVAVVVREIVIDEKQRKQTQNECSECKTRQATQAGVIQNTEFKAEEKAVIEEPEKDVKTEDVKAEDTIASDAANDESAASGATPIYIENDESAVVFSKGSAQSIDEKYLNLTSKYKGYYDEIVRCATMVEGSKRYKNSAYEEYKVGKNRLVRIKIKRDTIICELVILNLAFKNYINDNKVAMKQAPATIKVTDEASLNAVKDSIGIAVKAIEEEKAYKKEQAKQRRRENRAKAKANKAE